jgi:hypothetical protein
MTSQQGGIAIKKTDQRALGRIFLMQIPPFVTSFRVSSIGVVINASH